VIFANIEEAIQDKAIPLAEHSLLLLSEIRGLAKAKQACLSGSLQFSSLNEQILQKMVDYCSHLLLQFQRLLFDIVEAKQDLRQLFVYLHQQTLRLPQQAEQNENQKNNNLHKMGYS